MFGPSVTQTVVIVGQTQILFDDNISIIISPCVDKAGKIFGGQQWDYCNGHVTRGNGHLRAVTIGNARNRAVFSTCSRTRNGR